MTEPHAFSLLPSVRLYFPAVRCHEIMSKAVGMKRKLEVKKRNVEGPVLAIALLT